jgi:Na+/melibiose symporter-like transporter
MRDDYERAGDESGDEYDDGDGTYDLTGSRGNDAFVCCSCLALTVSTFLCLLPIVAIYAAASFWGGGPADPDWTLLALAVASAVYYGVPCFALLLACACSGRLRPVGMVLVTVGCLALWGLAILAWKWRDSHLN